MFAGALVSVQEEVESYESFAIQERGPDSEGPPVSTNERSRPVNQRALAFEENAGCLAGSSCFPADRVRTVYVECLFLQMRNLLNRQANWFALR